MGVDAVIKARFHTAPLEAPDQLMVRVRERFCERFPDEFANGHNRYPDLRWDRSEPGVIEVVSRDRFFGPGYERGDWAAIREIGEWLVDELKAWAEVRYGSDHDGDGFGQLRPWRQCVAENDELWARCGE